MVFGAAGQLGQTVVDVLQGTHQTIPLTRREVDLTDAGAVRQVVASHQPAVIVNCAAFNQVDQAEAEPQTAIAVNALAVRTLARLAREHDAVLVHYSSDFVFNGETDRPYTEEDMPQPQSVYAASKLMGEWFAADAPRYYVLRVESLFGGLGRLNSSCDKIVESIARGGPVRVFVDRVVSPSYAFDIADATRDLLRIAPAPGVYHCVNSGSTTWAALAELTAQRLGAQVELERVRMADVPLPARRPRYCALSNDKLRRAGVTMPHWQDSLERYLLARGWVASAQRN